MIVRAVIPPLFQDFITLKTSLFFLVVPYIHVLSLVLTHVAVITLSDASIVGYNLIFFSYYKLINNRVYGLYTWLNYKKLLI